MRTIEESELIINPDGSIYHLHITPDQLADDIIVVGDPGRVETISQYFDNIEHKVYNREFVTHTGTYKGKRLTVLATGIGTDNIDIVMNELDALVNIDLKTRQVKPEHHSLNIVRLGTSGALQEFIPVDSFVFSSYGLGLDGLLNFYKDRDSVIDKEMTDEFYKFAKWNKDLTKPYIVKASESLEKKISAGMYKGITATAPGFYGPQGRVLRLELQNPEMNSSLEKFKYNNQSITNFEMETSALYGLGKMLGHQTATVCAIIANRYNKTYSEDYKETVNKLIKILIDRLSE
ncbi:MAG: phosphorylase [Bacteroidetes bacterium 4572_112]|nr:MAG: phosphorylase [Bacteroidetes bacterium 4572_112]